MADQNLILYIKNEDGTAFHDLRLNKFAFTTTVMSLNSKIEGDFYYKDNTLSFTLAEYVEYKGMKYTLKNPPVIVKKGMTSDNSELKGMTKYTCTFYHEETELYNIPFTDVAVDSQEVSYRGEKRTFSWIGTITSFVAKVDQCLKGTKWRASLQPDFKDDGTLSDVLSFSNQFISDACKTAYETFKIPFVIDGYKILFGKPSNEILDKDGQPYIFQLGQGLGLKNNDVTPKNNKVITRIAGTGSEQNIPYGYPIIKNDAGEVIDHPYTRDHLMPTIYIQTLRHKLLVDSSTPLVDYYDADNTYPTPLNPLSPVFHIQNFEDIRPSIEGMTYLNNEIDTFKDVPTPEGGWDDYINPETGDVRQSYFDVTLYPLGFDLYAQAAVTSAMSFSMKSGNTLGANFEVAVDWEEVKKNFYVTDDNGNVIFKPDGDQRDLTKFPDSTSSPITITLTKDLETFGTLMPNQWQYPVAGDKFVILGIEMPQEYIDAAQDRLDAAMKKYMLENNMPLYDYPLEFDEFFLTNNIDILDQIKENAIIRFKYGNEAMALSVKEISVRYGYDKLPKYSITLTDDVSIVLNQIGQIADGLSKLGSQVAALQAVYGMDIYAELNRKLSRVKDDTSTGKITSTKGFQVGNFVTGSTGGIFNVDTLGKSHMELDYLTVRMKAFFYALEVIKTGVIGGRLMVTPGGAIECTKVEEFDTYYRCYFLANDGETKIENRFRQGDQALSEDFNVQAGVYEGVSNHYYWRLVVGTGENYIDLSKTDADTSKEFKSDIPKAGDTICQLGNRTDQTRQNALIMSAADTYSPSLTFYCGINNYSYLDKEYIEYGVDKTTNLAYMNVYGNSYIGARDRSTYIKYDTDTGVEIKGTLVTKSGRDVDQAFNSFQDQIDGVKETWYGEYSPNLTNYPASDWTTENLKKRHEGDVFTNIQPFISDETTPDAGKSWRWVQSNDTWGWTQIADSDTSKAYYEAAKAAKAAEEARKQVNEVNSTVNSMRDFTDDAFKDGVVGRSEAVTIQGYLNNISSIEKDITESYNKVYTNPLLESVPKTDLYDAYTGLKTSITELVATINNAIADGITTSVEVAEVDGRYNTFNTKYGDFIGYLNAANKAIQDNINNTALNAKKAAEESYLEAIAAQERLDEWADDGVISPTEKQGLKDEIARIDADKENIGTNFNLYSLGSPDAYNKAHADYRASLVSLSSPTPEIISIPSDFQGLQSTYYNQRTAALNTIAKATKDLLGDIGTDMNSYEYLKRAWGENTTVEGGLLFSSLAQFGSTTNNVFTVKSGINGISIDSRPGGGIASWYGGAMKDRADYTDDTMPSDVAKAVIRMDGSGYLANGAVWWGLDGKFHADPASFIINEDQIGDYLKLFQIIYKKPDKKDINYIVPQYPMQSLQIASYVEIGSTGYRIGVNPTTGLLRIYNLNGNTNFGVEIDGDLLVSGGVTAYTQGSRTASTILDGLAIDPNTLSKEGGILSVIGGAGGGGSVDGVILNGTTYSPNEDTKLITLPNYPTTLPASDVYAWAKASTKPAYSWSEITSKPSWIGSTKPTYSYSEITGKPTTLSGYGITDAVTLSTVQRITNSKTFASTQYFDQRSINFQNATIGGSATGLFWQKNGWGDVKASIGVFTAEDGDPLMYMGWGVNPWITANNFHVSSSEIQYKGNNILHQGNYTSYLDSRYVNAAGDTMTGNLNFKNNTYIYFNDNANFSIGSNGSIGTYLKYGSNTLAVTSNSLYYNNNTVWHAGNDGSGSGLDADKLDGYEETSFVRSWWTNSPGYNCNTHNGRPMISFTYNNGAPFSGGFIDVSCNGYGFYLGTAYLGDYPLYYKRHGITNDGGMGAWHQLARITDNVASATKLQTARTINGTSFDGTANIVTSYWGTTRHFYINSHNSHKAGAAVSVNGNGNVTLLLPDTISCSNWFRSTGNSGWHNETYGGGIWMSDSTYVKVYNKDWFRSNMFSAGNAQDDSYSIAYNACATYGSNWCCYSMIRQSTSALGMGFTTSSEIWLGEANTSRVAGSMWLRVGRGQMTYAGNFLATGGVTAYSQRSLKDVIGEADISLERLATIKPFYFTWKDKRDDRMHLGGIAEDVQELFPEVIYKTTDNILAMDYGNAAFAISAVLAQHTLRHESEIEQLKRENRELRDRIEELERKE